MKRTLSEVRQLNIPDDKLIEYYERGIDIERMADKYDDNAFAKAVALAEAEEWSVANPVPPVDSRTVALARAERMQKHLGKCPSSWIHGTDDAGHSFGKEIYCGLEYCPVCGQKNSAAHLRRFARWLPKVQSVSSIGYFVIEMPLRGRERWHSKVALEKAGKLATSVLKGDYEIEQRRAAGEIVHKSAVDKIHSRWFTQGLRRWHYFGDSPEQISAAVESEQGVEQLALSDDFSIVKYNPHLNIIVSAGMIPAEKLEHIKAILRQAFNEPQLIVNYSFTTEPGRMVHLLKYVTRATFLDIRWDKFLAGSLYGFRNMRSWGRWDADEPVWSLTDLTNTDAAAEVAGLNVDAINKLGQSFCYIDGLPITWSRPQPISILHLIQERQPDKVQSLGAGYFQLPDIFIPVKDAFESPEMILTKQINGYLADYRAEQRCKHADTGDVTQGNNKISAGTSINKLVSSQQGTLDTAIQNNNAGAVPASASDGRTALGNEDIK
jgi:hypothetical protein